MTTMTSRQFSEVELIRSICLDSLWEFVREFWGEIIAEKPVWNWHMKYLCDRVQIALERVFAGKPKLYDIIINVPPGTSKSSLISIMADAWCKAKMPSLRFLGASYSHDLAEDLSRKTRDVLKTNKYQECFPWVKIRDDIDAKSHFETTKGGVRRGVGSGGVVIGTHYHVVAVDDPIDPESVYSDAEVNEVNRWITGTLDQRVVDKRIYLMIVIMQRLHENDPTGYLLSTGREVMHYRLPADTRFEIHPPSLRRKYRGGLLDPVRLPKKVLDKEEQKGQFHFSSQYGQCLVAGTLVTTKRGLVPIERVVVGDQVLTRDGSKKVLWSGKTKNTEDLSSVLFDNGSIITGTPDHPVWVKDRGWVSLDALSGGMYNVAIPNHCGEKSWADSDRKKLKCSGSTGLTTSKAQTKSTTEVVTEEESGCIGTFGGTTTETFPLASIYTTRTKTRVTMTLTIWNVSASETTACDILLGSERNSIESFLLKSVSSAKLGINRKKVRSIIRKTAKSLLNICGKGQSIKLTFALPVGRNISRVSCTKKDQFKLPSFARSCVRLEAGLESTTKVVLGAAARSKPEIVGQFVVPGDAPLSAGVPVYDLHVEESHEFFANGVLVHNCPIPLGGGMFHTSELRYGRPPSDFKKVVRFWDKAASAGTGAFSVGVKMALDQEDRIWILDVARGQWDSAKRERRIDWCADQDGVTTIVSVEQEPGPIWEEDLVTMGNGCRCPLKLVAAGDYVINSSGVPTRVLKVHKQGRLEILRVETDSGRVVHAALNHPFLTPQGWVKASDLEVGSVLALRSSLISEPDTSPTLEECRLAGYFVGDGCCTFAKRNGVVTKTVNANVVCSDPIQGADVIHCAETLGAVCVGGSKGWTYSMSGGIRSWLADRGLAGKGTSEKRVPDWVWTATDEQVANFIGAFFACDGCASNYKGKLEGIEFYSVNRPLLEDVQSLLLRFGIYSRLRSRVYQPEVQSTRKICYRLTLRRGDDSFARFSQMIPVYGKKSERLKNLTRSDFDKEHLPDPVVKIERIGELPCRCITVEEGESFLANDFVVHNSGGKESAERTQLRLAQKGYICRIIRPQGDKVIRADPFSVQVNQGNVYLVENAPWIADYVDEMKYFPHSKYKDQMDASSGAHTELTRPLLELGAS